MPGLTSTSDVFDSIPDFLSMPYHLEPLPEPLPLSERFAKLKRKLIAGHEAAIVDSWYRLLRRLREEADHIAAVGSDIIPTIDFLDIHHPEREAAFARQLRQRGVGVIRRVVPANVAAAWKEETLEYVDQGPQRPPRGFPADDPQMFDLYWSPGQVKARADSRMLEAQRFAMRAWHHRDHPDAAAATNTGRGNNNNDDDPLLISPDHPVAYADRFRVRRPGDTSMGKGPHVDGGSVERWEPDGYGRGGGTYRAIFEGRWEAHDPWDSSARLAATSDLYNGAGACGVFRMFQGWLALSPIQPGEGTLLACPMLPLTTAYVLLRPFFTPLRPPTSSFSGGGYEEGGGGGIGEDLDFLHESNWALQARPDSVVQGAVPGHIQELSDAMHPHLRLRRTLVSVPRVDPGDWVIWHPDTVHGADALHAGRRDSSVLYIPACPLTQTNALYLARQRRAFLLGQPAPDFFGSSNSSNSGSSAMGADTFGGLGLGLGFGGAVLGGGGGGSSNNSSSGGGESAHLGRPGVQDVADAGGEDGLRAMGLLAFDEARATSRVGREVVRLANGILFPDRFDLGYKRRPKKDA